MSNRSLRFAAAAFRTRLVRCALLIVVLTLLIGAITLICNRAADTFARIQRAAA